MNKCICFLAILILIQAFAGCTNKTSPVVMPQDENIGNSFSLPVEKQNESNRNILGAWTLVFDPVKMEINLTPYRDLSVHYNATRLIPAPVISINSYDPVSGILNVDITISNPYSITVYDPRIIIFTDNAGHKLLNADSWTALYDKPAGLPINPFKAFAKLEPNRRFTGQSQLIENLRILLPGGNSSVVFAIDASYPENCEEPYEINSFQQQDLFETIGATAQIQINVLDWYHDVNTVKLYCPEITGTTLVDFAQQTLETWNVNIVNNTGADPGFYTAYIVATSENSGNLALYNEFKIQVLNEGDRGWAQTWGGADQNSGAFGSGVVVDEKNGFVYSVGAYTGTIDFDPGPGTTEFTTTPSDMFAYVAKYDLAGNFVTAFSFGDGSDGGYFQAIRIAVDSFGDLYVCGNYWGTVDFMPGTGSSYKSSVGNWDFFVAKYSPTGTLKWVLSSGGSYRDYCFNIAVDDSDKIYVGGTFESTMDFNPNSGIAERSPISYSDAFIVCYNRNGYYQWVNTFGSSYNSYCIGLDTEDNDVYATGYFDGVIDFDPGAGIAERAAIGYVDCYLLQYDNLGNFKSVNTWGGSWLDDTKGFSVSVDKYKNAFVFGVYDGFTDFDPGPNEDVRSADSVGQTFICKYDSNYAYQWVKTLKLDMASSSVDRQMTVSDDSDVFLAGYYDEPVDFDPSPNLHQLTPVGSYDLYLVKLDTNGEFQWAYSWGDDSSDTNAYVDTDSNGNSYSTGNFYGTVDFNPGTGVDEHSSGPGAAGFMMKINTNGNWF
jgi:hypothetical protein